MQPVDIQVIGRELAIRWDDGVESFLPLEAMRRQCPCAGCQGEPDVMGNVHRGPARPLTARSFEIKRIDPVGGYGLQPVWGDGHATGIYAFDTLRRLGQPPA